MIRKRVRFQAAPEWVRKIESLTQSFTEERKTICRSCMHMCLDGLMKLIISATS